jgi:amino acid transporter
VSDTHRAGQLKRSVGFWGLMFVSLGSIIGSGWLLGALNAAEVAGPASILSWLLAGVMLSLLALTYAELGATYPVAGGAARYPYYSHGAIVGFTAGWASWLQAVFIPPIEAVAVIQYTNSVKWVHDNFNMIHTTGADAGLLNSTGVLVALGLMVLFTAINLAGAKFLSDSNIVVVVWKTIVPFLAVFVVAAKQFNVDNFSAGGGFMPFGWHGVFAALTGGVVFGMQGFEQAAQLAGEARDPKRDLSRAILAAMAIGAVLYTLLQVVLIGALEPSNIAGGWSKPLGTDPSNYGAWYTLALAVGVGWLATALLIDAVVSPAGTGVVYVGTTARLSYALGEEREMPSALARTNKRGVPVVSTLLAFVIGCISLGPFKSWQALVNMVTGATAIMYAFAPIALVSLQRLDPDRPRPYRVPFPRVVLPAAFCSANLIIYWGGFGNTWKLVVAVALGLVMFAIGAVVNRTGAQRTLRHAVWMAPWFGGHILIGILGRYGGGEDILPPWIDLLAVIAFSIAIYLFAIRVALPKEGVAEGIAKDAHQLASV